MTCTDFVDTQTTFALYSLQSTDVRRPKNRKHGFFTFVYGIEFREVDASFKAMLGKHIL